MNEKQKNTEGKGRGSCGMNVIVGSWEQGREDCDMDIWGELETPPKVGYPKVDYCTMPLSILSMIPTSDVLLPCGNSMGLATRDALYTIKCSHLGWDIKWDKTKRDVLYLSVKGAKLLPVLYYSLVQHWKKEHHNKEYLSLYKSTDRFFDDHVTYKYDHDYLHELVAIDPEGPVYKKCLIPGQEVAICRESFERMPFCKRVQMFREEIAVIAIERWLTNDVWKGKVPVTKAHNMSVKKTILHLTKNWATDFLVTNLVEFVMPETGRYYTPTLNKLKRIPYEN